MEYANLVPYLRKLAKNLDEFVGEDIRSKVLEGCETLTAKTSKIKRAEMMKDVMTRMDALIDKDISIKIRENCACKPKAFLKTSIEIFEKYPNIEDFISELQKTHFAGKFKIEDNIIDCNFGTGKCVCGMVKSTKESIPILWCECCKGHVKWIFEGTLKRSLHIEMTSSVVSGSDDCRFKIYLG
jgi:hypothetical protein